MIDYIGGKNFDLWMYLNGDIDCEGVIYGLFGCVLLWFVGCFNVNWIGGVGYMIENFEYDFGSI